MTMEAAQLKQMGLSEDGETILIRKFHSHFPKFDYEYTGDTAWGAVLDVETTGLNRQQDKIIEIGIRKFRFEKSTGRFLEAGEFFNGYQDPGFPLSEEIVKLTGITDEMVRGKVIDWLALDQWLENVEIIVAHNAGFDRPFVERLSTRVRSLRWACTFKQLNWKDKGFASAKLEVLALFHGFFTDAHRALNDSDALLYLLTFKDQTTNEPYLCELLRNAARPYVRSLATGSPFETKDLLRSRGYQWDNVQRVWHKTLYKDEAPQEIAWLEAHVYHGPTRGKMIDIPVEDNFK